MKGGWRGDSRGREESGVRVVCSRKAEKRREKLTPFWVWGLAFWVLAFWQDWDGLFERSKVGPCWCKIDKTCSSFCFFMSEFVSHSYRI